MWSVLFESERSARTVADLSQSWGLSDISMHGMNQMSDSPCKGDPASDTACSKPK